jgi:hypothetical protein
MDTPDRIPHTCSLCRVIQVTLPSPAEVRDGLNRGLRSKFFPFVQLDGPRVLAGSYTCSFLNWAMRGFRRVTQDESMDQSWTLKGAINMQALLQYPDLQSLEFLWYHRGERNFKADLDILAVLSEPGKISPFLHSVLPATQAISRPAV